MTHCLKLSVRGTEFIWTKSSLKLCFNLSNCKQIQSCVLISLLGLDTKLKKYNQKEVALTHYKADVSVLTRCVSNVKKLFLRYKNFSLSLILFIKLSVGSIHILTYKLGSVHKLNMKNWADGDGCYWKIISRICGIKKFS